MMTDPITNRAEELLSHTLDIFVPLEHIYTNLLREGLMAWTDVRMLQALLEADTRFEVIQGLEQAIFHDEESAADLGALNFMSGPWVMLSVRKNSPIDVMNDLLRHLQQMNHALEEAWQGLWDEPELQANLVNLLMIGDMLERKVRQALEEALNQRVEERFPYLLTPRGPEA